MELLKELYLTNAKSGHEDLVSEIVQRELTLMKIPFNIDPLGQIHRIIENNPMLCAHMDQVQNLSPNKIIYSRGEIFGISKKGKARGLGADDKNGIWICLRLLKQYPDTSFIFSTEEEHGGNVQHLLHEEKPESRFALVFDRKGDSDIVGSLNAYCEDDLIEALVLLSEELNMDFEECRGIFSDCDHLNKYIPCVNISCGYHDAHSAHEYTVLNELKNSLRFGKAILETYWEDEFSLPAIHVFDSLDSVNIDGFTRPSKQRWISTYNDYEELTIDDIDLENDLEDDTFADEDWLTCRDCGMESYKDDMGRERTCPYCGKHDMIEYISEETVRG